MASGCGGLVFEVLSKDELVQVKTWERMIDEDSEAAEGLFFAELRRASNKLQHDRPRKRPFKPPPQPAAAAASNLGSPPPSERVFTRMTVLALPAPDPALRRGPKNRSTKVARGTGHPPHARSLVQPRRPSTTKFSHNHNQASAPQPSTKFNHDRATPAGQHGSVETVMVVPCAPPHLPREEVKRAPSFPAACAPPQAKKHHDVSSLYSDHIESDRFLS